MLASNASACKIRHLRIPRAVPPAIPLSTRIVVAYQMYWNTAVSA